MNSFICAINNVDRFRFFELCFVRVFPAGTFKV